MLADLHLHTHCSDGTLSPKETVAQAAQAGIGLLAVCDHNNVDAYGEVKSACDALGISCLSGVEIDCQLNGLSLHLLGLGIDTENPTLLALLHRARALLDAMSDDLISAMEANGAPVSLKEFHAFARDPSQGGWKGINYLATKGFPGSYPQCMALYATYHISPREPWPSVWDTCTAIHLAGGKAILAHPGDRLPKDFSNFSVVLQEIHVQGLDGVECYYPSHSAAIAKLCVDYCNKNRLCITCGSDCHGAFAKEIHGVVYSFGAACQDTACLRLKGLFV